LTEYIIYAYQPSTGLVQIHAGRSGASGERSDRQSIVLDGTQAIDADSDGIPDIGEMAIGSGIYTQDTDGDGLSDSAEIAAGLDPLGGRAFPTGVVASLPLQGQAKAVTLEGSTTTAETQTAYVATGSYGLAIVDASNFQHPLVLSQLDLTGDAVDVAVDARLNIAAVAGTSALHLINVSDAAAPVLARKRSTFQPPRSRVGERYRIRCHRHRHRILQPAHRRTAAAAAGRRDQRYHQRSRATAQHSTPSMRAGNSSAIDISGLAMTVLGRISVPTGTGNVFVGNGIAYIGAVNTTSSGFVTVDVSNPASDEGAKRAHLRPTSRGRRSSPTALDWPSPWASAFTLSAPDPTANVLDIRDPTNTENFLTSFNLAADPFDITIGAGIAFVADGTGGLQVVNYLPFDNQGQAPTITLSAPARRPRPSHCRASRRSKAH
jgi:hypothetical protein